jgi:hypothetical protein
MIAHPPGTFSDQFTLESVCPDKHGGGQYAFAETTYLVRLASLRQ